MPPSSFGLAGPTYQSRDGLWAGERSINWFPAIDESGHAKSKVSLQPCPGLVRFANITGDNSPPIRGLWAGEERLFAVCGAQLSEVFSDGSFTDLGDVGSAADTPVQFAASGLSLVMAAGNSIWRASGTAMTTLGSHRRGRPHHQYEQAPLATIAITKVYQGAISVVFLDGYYIILLENSNTVQISDLNSDGTVWDPLDQQTKMGSLDRLVRLEVHEGHLWLFGTHTIEVWQNTGNPDFPFERISGSNIDQGTTAPYSVAQIDGHLYWLGRDLRGRGRVYRSDGYTPVRISNQSIEYLIDSYLALGVDELITGYGYQEDGHTFYVMGFPKAKACLVYDLESNMWHERARWNGTAWEHWRGSAFHAHVFGRHFVARTSAPSFPDNDHRVIYEQSVKVPHDDTLEIRRLRVAPYVQNDQQWLMHHYLRLYTDSAAAVAMRYRNDEATDWSNVRTVAPFKHEVKYRRLGRARDRLYEVSISSNTQSPMLMDAWVHVTPGVER